MANTCSLWVSENGNYCCAPKVFTVGDHAVTVSIANMGGVDLLVFPTGDTSDVSVVHSTLEDGSTTITDAGVYLLDIDCDALDGTPAPADVLEQSAACCSSVLHSDLNSVLIYEKLCEIEAGGGGLEFPPWVQDVLNNIEAAVETPTPVESSFAQVGCIVEGDEQVGVVMACKKPDLTFQMWAFYPGQPPVPDYSGPWEICSSESLCAPEDDLGVLDSFDALRAG